MLEKHKKIPNTYHIGFGCSFGDSNHSVHKHIAKNLNAQLINLSRGGQGNYRILTELIAWINSHSKDINKTTVSIGWSGMYRNDIIENIEKSYRTLGMFNWKVWRADKDDPVLRAYPKIDIIVDHMIRYRVLITATQNFLENHNIKYVMYNALNNHVDIKIWKKNAIKFKVMEKAINFNKFYKFDDSQQKFINKNKYWLDPSPRNYLTNAIGWPNDDYTLNVKDAHPSPTGDKKWANLVWNFCKENKVF